MGFTRGLTSAKKKNNELCGEIKQIHQRAPFEQLPPTPALVPKSAKEKIAIPAKATTDAWMRVPEIDVPVKGPGSSPFDLPPSWGTADVGPGTAAARQVASASFGWKASAAGPERIFSTASLWDTALKSNYSVVMLGFMVFLKKN